MSDGYLCLDGWSGRTRKPIDIIDETPKRYRIRAITRTKLAGRNRWLNPGESALVPKYAVVDKCETCDGKNGGIPGNENIVNGKIICDYCYAKRM